MLDAVLVGVGAAAADGLVDRRGEPGHVVGGEPSRWPVRADPLATQDGVVTEGRGEPLVERETVGRYVPDPGADDGTGRQGELDAFGVDPRHGLAPLGLVAFVAKALDIVRHGQSPS